MANMSYCRFQNTSEDSDGGIEIKCPSTSKEHLRHIFEGVPKEYFTQIQGHLMVTGRIWWNFVSFDPRIIENCINALDDANWDLDTLKESASSKYEAQAIRKSVQLCRDVAGSFEDEEI